MPEDGNANLELIGNSGEVLEGCSPRCCAGEAIGITAADAGASPLAKKRNDTSMQGGLQSSYQDWLMGVILLCSRLSSQGGKLEVHRISLFLAVLCKDVKSWFL